MHRTEKRKRYLILLFAAILLFLVAVTLIRVAVASGSLTAKDFKTAIGRDGIIVDRNGNTLYDADTFNEELFGNLFGGTGYNNNTLKEAYESDMLNGFTLLRGAAGMSQKKQKVMQTTLLGEEAQQQIADAFGGKRGCCFSYNYITGEIYTMLSLPSAAVITDENDVSGALRNRCLDDIYIPGSTMKIVASICALEQDQDLIQATRTCNGGTKLPDGKEVTCTEAVHGTVDFTDALGVSCNVYFAGMIQKLNIEEAQATLKQLGFVQDHSVEKNNLGELSKTVSSTAFTAMDYSNIWSLIGQGNSQVNVMDMAQIAGAVANGGQTAEPYLVAGFYTEGKENKTTVEPDIANLFSRNTADILDEYWTAAVNGHYRSGSNTITEKITYAKTGTAQLGGNRRNKLLLGVCKDSNTAFMIVVEDYRKGDPTAISIANVLARGLPEE